MSGDRGERGSVVGEVLRLTGPAVLTSLLQTVVFLVDRVMLGRHGAASLASMQISGTVMWSVFSVFFGALVGTVALVARRVGAGELDRARLVARAALRLAALLGIVVAALGCVGAGVIAAGLAPPALGTAAEIDAALEIEASARIYMRLGFLAFPALFVAATGALILNGSGDTRTPFRVGLIANLVNLVGDLLLIFGADIGPLHVPELGAAGAALATGLAYVVEAIAIMVVLRRPRCPVHVRADRQATRADEAGARRALIRLSLPAIAERVVIHVGYVVLTGLVASLGPEAMAANQALLTLESICFLGAEGFGVAAATVVGQHLGRGQPGNAGRGGWVAAGACALALSACGLLIWLTAPWTLPVFVAADEAPAVGERLIAVAMTAIPFLVIAQPAMAFTVVLGHSLRGAGDTRSPVISAAVGGLLIRLSAVWLLAFELGLGLRGLWIATACDWFVRTLILGWIFARGRWRTLAV